MVVPFFPPTSKTYEKFPYWVSFFFMVIVVIIDSFSVAVNRKRHCYITWYLILVYMGYLASKKERISSSARVG